MSLWDVVGIDPAKIGKVVTVGELVNNYDKIEGGLEGKNVEDARARIDDGDVDALTTDASLAGLKKVIDEDFEGNPHAALEFLKENHEGYEHLDFSKPEDVATLQTAIREHREQDLANTAPDQEPATPPQSGSVAKFNAGSYFC
jgi:hypothetical protein